MKYMHKKDEDTLVPYDEFIYDATEYVVVDEAPQTRPAKAKKPKLVEEAPSADVSDEDFSFPVGD